MTFQEHLRRAREAERQRRKKMLAELEDNDFEHRLARKTLKKITTVRMWRYGQKPDPLTQRTIAQLLGESVEELFPEG